MKRWLTAIPIALGLCLAVNLLWPDDPFHMLRKFNPTEHGSYPMASQNLVFSVPVQEVRAALKLAPGQQGYFNLPDGSTAYFQEYGPEFRPATCYVSQWTDDERWLSDPVVAAN
jgi:hypothetical protein